MSLTTNEVKTVLNGATFTWPTDSGGPVTSGLAKFDNHRVEVTGAGTGTVSVDFGGGFKTVDTLSADFNTYLLSGANFIKIVASVDDLTLTIKSYS